MGGTVFCIPVEPPIELIEAALHPRPTWWQRLTGTAPAPPRDDDFCLDLPTRSFAKWLVGDYRATLRAWFPKPWTATREFFEYLRVAPPEVFLRVDRAGAVFSGDASVQLGFSGCAGQAETSAALAEHWAAAWFQERRAAISRGLSERAGLHGRAASGAGVDPDPPRFLPIGVFGYAARVDDSLYADLLRDAAPGERVHRFVPDNAAVEISGDPVEAVLVTADERFGAPGATGVCRCQRCAPEFDGDWFES